MSVQAIPRTSALAQPQPFTGVLAPVVTSFKADLTPDGDRFLAHCRWLLAHGCDGLAVFGTNSEANSLSVAERTALLDRLIDGGVEAARLMPGTGACALPDAVQLTQHAVKRGCGGVLMLPPFYYKGVSEEGLYAFFSEVVQRVASDKLRLYLYHIPPVAVVPIPLTLIGRLIKAYPGIVVGIKDSSGDWNNTKAVLEAYPGFGTFAGSEAFLLQTLRGGGVGCITATGNVDPQRIRRVFETWTTAEADGIQERVSQFRKVMQKYPMIPALKAVIGHFRQDKDWRRVRPPLVAMDDTMAKALIADVMADGFDMPGI
ncbi:MAG: dihydrodipicolinate synthase family protein [Proteobacteria bacterium]|nr:dihydrodipicolinate synthase family protein [Pseudomonadota bacterium]MBI3498399.1 dihydrodipicolinate synthase family protein [Pseudomonadota bacterium]